MSSAKKELGYQIQQLLELKYQLYEEELEELGDEFCINNEGDISLGDVNRVLPEAFKIL